MANSPTPLRYLPIVCAGLILISMTARITLPSTAIDTDGDGIDDTIDLCVNGSGWTSNLTSDPDGDGCNEWALRGGGSGSDNLYDMEIDSKGDVVVVGEFSGSTVIGNTTLVSRGGTDVFVAKASSSGQWLWAISAGGGSSNDEAKGLAIDSNDNIYIAGDFTTSAWFGSTFFNSAGGADAFLAKISPDGAWQWALRGGGTGYEYIKDIAVDGSGNAVIVGQFDGTTTFGSWSVTSQGRYDILVAYATPSGSWSSIGYAGGSQTEVAYGVDVAKCGSNLCAYVTGVFAGTASFSGTQITATGSYDAFVGVLGNGGWGSVLRGGGNGFDKGTAIAVGPHGQVMVTGGHEGGSFGSTTLSSRGNQDVFLANVSGGTWRWASTAGYSGSNELGNSISFDAAGNPVVTGTFAGTMQFGSLWLQTHGYGDAFIGTAHSSTGSWISVQAEGGTQSESGMAVAVDAGGNTVLAGTFYSYTTLGDDQLTGAGGNDLYIYRFEDSDDDGVKDYADDLALDPTQTTDTDGDGYGDNPSGNNPDSCTSTAGNSTANGTLGCIDTDGDGYADNASGSDNGDQFPTDPTQWADTDHDGYGDNTQGTLGDFCPTISGNSTSPYGCPDNDGDGVANITDFLPDDASQTSDSDNDGYGDNPNGTNGDRFPTDGTQWNDTDNDGYGDNPNGNNPDRFPSDSSQWNDSDNDGYGDNPNGTNPDRFPNDGTQWNDSDNDGYGDNATGNNPDRFASDSSQWNDSDNDGYGDNPNGTNPDRFPSDGTQWNDTDGDGYGDNMTGNNPDRFPGDATQWADRDADGYGDNPNGTSPDAFPDDSTQISDLDGDGYGDNPLGNNPDWFITDPTQWNDTDGDGYGDNPTGTDPDAFPTNPYQWNDTDGDGYGDNTNGTDGDAFPSDSTQWADSDNDGFGDNPNGTDADAFPNDATQHSDPDNDGYGSNLSGNNPDYFPLDSTQWADNDGDGYGDNLGGTEGDSCVAIWGASNLDIFGCPDYDGDGISNIGETTNYLTNATNADTDGGGIDDGTELFVSRTDPFDPTDDLIDSDNDSVIDGLDAFPNDPTQTGDLDGDGYGDNPNGTNPDGCPVTAGNSTQPLLGCLDSDGDGLADTNDTFPLDPNETTDTDNDTIGDNEDDCPTVPGSSTSPLVGCPDSDGDGVNDADDTYPNDPTETTDTDGDGYGDNGDSCPNEWGNSTAGGRLGCVDSDGDGWADIDEVAQQNNTNNTDPGTNNTHPGTNNTHPDTNPNNTDSNVNTTDDNQDNQSAGDNTTNDPLPDARESTNDSIEGTGPHNDVNNTNETAEDLLPSEPLKDKTGHANANNSIPTLGLVPTLVAIMGLAIMLYSRREKSTENQSGSY